MEFPNWLSQRAVQKKDAIALIFRSGVSPKSTYWTYSQLETDVNEWVNYLQILGIKSGDRVGLLLTNHPRYIILVHALVKCEAIAVFLNIRLTATELQWQIEDSLVKYLLCDELTRSTADQMRGLSVYLSVYILGFRSPPAPLKKGGEEFSSSPFLRGIEGDQLISFKNIQGVFYTSGTTGKPKAVPLTYGNHFYSAIASALQLGINHDDNWLLCMPMFHVGGLAIVWRNVINGTKITLLPKFDEQEVLEAIAVEKVTMISLVPTMLNRLLQHPHWQNLQKLRAILLGGAPASLELIDRCIQLNLPIMPTYGMTETASQITTLLPHELLTKRGSSGLPLFGHKLRIVDLEDSTKAIPIGEVGQILVQGATVMSGYLHQESDSIQDDWFHTGDLGYLDRAGYLYVVSRRSDLIISGGENIYPTEIESILLTHSEIMEACVVGIGDREWGEIVAAVIVTKAQLSLAEVRNFCEQKSLARYKLPKVIFIWDSLPKTASGKLLRQEIRDHLKHHDLAFVITSECRLKTLLRTMNALTISLESVIDLTDEQFFQLCRKNSELRIERNSQGDITIMAPEGGVTGMRSASITIDLGIWNRKTKLGFTFGSSTGFKLPNGSDRSPDASWILKERWEALTSEQQAKFAPICPDFVIELMSPSDNLKVTQEKMEEYQDNGARLGWLINRKDREVEVYRIGKSKEVLQNPISLSGEDVLPEFVLSLAEIW